jgi:alpha 1,6-mannosyltransferase
LLARYNVTWHRLRALDHPLRIGDVLILPITAFSPGGEPDFHAEPGDSIQADVIHGCKFRLLTLSV